MIESETVWFDGSASSDPDGTIVSYEWDFGDGEPPESGVNVSHVYSTDGIYTVTLTVTDDDDATCTDDAIVTVLTPAGAIDDLINIVEGMNLQQGIENSLDAKLDAAQDALIVANADQRNDAIKKLEALIQAVEAQRGKKLTNEQADQLVEYINRIISALSDPPLIPRPVITNLPENLLLNQNSPNPFNPATTIEYGIPAGTSRYVTLKVYDLRGALVKTLVDNFNSSGVYSVVWDGTDKSGNRVSSGIYIYTLQAGEFTKSNKMMLMR